MQQSNSSKDFIFWIPGFSTEEMNLHFSINEEGLNLSQDELWFNLLKLCTCFPRNDETRIILTTFYKKTIQLLLNSWINDQKQKSMIISKFWLHIAIKIIFLMPFQSLKTYLLCCLVYLNDSVDSSNFCLQYTKPIKPKIFYACLLIFKNHFKMLGCLSSIENYTITNTYQDCFKLTNHHLSIDILVLL